MNTVAVIGLGYVGKSLAVAISQNTSLEVTGLDQDGFHCMRLNDANLGFWSTHEESDIANKDVYVICVQTPETNGIPNDHFLIAAAKLVERQASRGALVIVESTAPIGTMDRELAPIFNRAGLLSAYSPERVNPGDTNYNIKNTTKLVAGTTPEATQKAKDFYQLFIDNVVTSNNVKSVEAAKILENAYRLINISFINQFASASMDAGLDYEEIISLAATKEFGFQKFMPSAGVGGHCIPVDPVFMQHYFNKHGTGIPILNDSLLYNAARPHMIAHKILSEYNLINKKVILIGMSYKPDINDYRNSPGQKIFEDLRKAGIDIVWNDTKINQIVSLFSSEITDKYDYAIIVQMNSDTDLSGLRSDCVIIDVSDGL